VRVLSTAQTYMVCGSEHARRTDDVKMRKSGSTLVAFLCTALVYSTYVHCLDKDDFSLKLREVAESILGVKEFQVLNSRLT